MKFKFKSQQYQTDAVNSVVNVFKGQNNKKSNNVLYRSENDSKANSNLFGNKINQYDLISHSNNEIENHVDLLQNIQEIQKNNNLKVLDTLDKSNIKNNKLDLTVEMETGTGKTFVYLNTIFELNKKYGWTKFIIIVPSIAIKEGVKSSIQDTEYYFKSKYNKTINYFLYDSKDKNNLNNISKYVDDELQVMIINYQSFNKEFKKDSSNNKIYTQEEYLNYLTPIDYIKSVKPILIFDEPQKFGKKTLESISIFEPLFTIRYSATHKKDENFNLVYQLTPIDAFNMNLVKNVGVKCFNIKNNTGLGTYLFLDDIIFKPNKEPQARLKFEEKTKNGDIRLVSRIVSIGDDLYYLSNKYDKYKGYIVEQIDGTDINHNTLTFENGEKLKIGDLVGDESLKELRRIQIARTIHTHFEKEKKLFAKNIKTLSLFFIDKVMNYRIYDENNNPENGEYAQIFEEEYIAYVENVIKDLKLSNDPNDVNYLKYIQSIDTKGTHAGYFSIDKNNKLVDPDLAGRSNNKYAKNSSDFELIMKDKKSLLDLNNPRQVRFIFSHSALQEGWDNPNVFQICTLKESSSTDKKRQELGRGLRICVNNYGERQDSETIDDFEDINKLTVIASESYADFADKLQKEYSDDGLDSTNVNITDENKVTTFTPGTNINFENNQFKKLWNIISQKATFQVDFDTNKLIESSVKMINEVLKVPSLIILEEEANLNSIKDADEKAKQIGVHKSEDKDFDYREIDLVGEICKNTFLTRKTVVKVLNSIDSTKFNYYKKRPDNFIAEVSKLINKVKSKISLEMIMYLPTDEKYSEELFKDYYKAIKGTLNKDVFSVKKHISDKIKIDSIGTERRFFEDLETGLVEVYAKLPNNYKIPTPIGDYNPDWLVVLKQDNGFKKVHFIVETKGSNDGDDLRSKELYKTEYAKKYFDTLKSSNVNYTVASDYDTVIEQAM